MYPYSVVFLFIALSASLLSLSGTNLTANVLAILFWALFAVSVVVGALLKEHDLDEEDEWGEEEYDFHD